MGKQGERGISWTDVTWNPIRGCTRVSEGCRHCYAERVAARFSGPGQPYAELAIITPAGPRWTGKVVLVEDHLEDPKRWQKPRRVFVNSMGDLFHESIADEAILRVWAVMQAAPRHQFQVLTKRAERMADWVGRWCEQFESAPPSNIWLGVSAEDQATADLRLPWLLKTPAAVRFLSAEPLLSKITLYAAWLSPNSPYQARLDWVIGGGESGPQHRPCHPAWARALRDACASYAIPFHWKQWGGPTAKSGGKELDGREWCQFPMERVAA
jgi:protein gp37